MSLPVKIQRENLTDPIRSYSADNPSVDTLLYVYCSRWGKICYHDWIEYAGCKLKIF